MLSVECDEAWLGLVETLGNESLRDPRFASEAGRRRHHDEIDRQIEAWTSMRARDESVDALEGAGVVAASVLTAREVLDHPQLIARRFWSTLERAYVGPIPNPAAPYRFTSEPAAIARVTPTLGQDSRTVLATLLGLDGDELDALEADGVIGEEPALPAPG
jgi:crotonobetainyl-CoA:carnitine CoA-transferase CaiB-like acyl-CoA transferase